MPIIPSARSRRKDLHPADTLRWQIEAGLGLHVDSEFRFHEQRRWRVDLFIPASKLGIEIEGGFFLPRGGRHNRGAGARADCEKYCELAIAGYRLLRVLPEWVASGKAFSLVERAVKGSA